MLSPTDATKGTFARAQAEVLSPTRTLFVKESETGVEVEVSAAQPGEVVVLHGASGAEMEGTVYYMSGGGKGPAGKSKIKFKSKYCPTGDMAVADVQLRNVVISKRVSALMGILVLLSSKSAVMRNDQADPIATRINQ
jgi:hypothetical protein